MRTLAKQPALARLLTTMYWSLGLTNGTRDGRDGQPASPYFVVGTLFPGGGGFLPSTQATNQPIYRANLANDAQLGSLWSKREPAVMHCYMPIVVVQIGAVGAWGALVLGRNGAASHFLAPAQQGTLPRRPPPPCPPFICKDDWDTRWRGVRGWPSGHEALWF
ncbi:hypothetical protein GGS24DRAFT_270770 [Hypoxylon argillaceum]|nr:hypothetical protein GGS24DRAFT_270770 [Hypoxylon argillaceum]